MHRPVAQADSADKVSRAERVLEALRRHARRDLTWPLPSRVAAELGVSVDTVQRAIADLIAERLIEWTGLRNGKARVYRLLAVESPQADEGSPHLAVVDRTAGAPLGATPAVAATRPGSPQAVVDRNRLDTFEWTPELRADYANRARAVFERLAFGDSLPTFPEASEGECGDCRQVVPDRQRYGKFDLCRKCLARRYTLGMKMGAAVVIAEASP
jgi:hypothetical protein